MERLNLSKEEVVSCLKDFLENFYDSEFEDVILNNDEKKRSVLLSKVFLAFFIILLYYLSWNETKSVFAFRNW